MKEVEKDVLSELQDFSVSVYLIQKALSEATKEDLSESLDRMFSKKGTKSKQISNVNNLIDGMVKDVLNCKKIFNDKFNVD